MHPSREIATRAMSTCVLRLEFSRELFVKYLQEIVWVLFSHEFYLREIFVRDFVHSQFTTGSSSANVYYHSN